ncbi:hypothetical protein BV20DRAFT_353149 [Pilatotrama ljubarskyi]|nr:hypothetical protein BV20DRAFT_353149 [Pilatotrama ljubarskyi]
MILTPHRAILTSYFRAPAPFLTLFTGYTMSTAPWDIYAEQLMHLGYGYPLWIPDPAPEAAQVQIGDVGWVNDGEFVPLFNAPRGENDAQPRGGVPVDHVPLETRDLTIPGPRDKIWQPVLCSRSIRKVEVSGGMSASVPSSSPSCEVNFNFECTDDAGALLFLSPSGRTQDILSRRRILDYMETHFDHWLEFANDRLGLGLREEQIMFVSGTTKTSRWGVAAFKGKARNQQGTVVGSFGSFASADFSMTISDAQLSTGHYRAGPPGRATGGSAVDASCDEHDQCVFIHYYKRRKRWPFFPSVFKAAAGPHNLPRDSEASGDEELPVDWEMSSDCFSEERFERFPHQDQVQDPAGRVLDYILENSNAAVAFASDLDCFAWIARSEKTAREI